MTTQLLVNDTGNLTEGLAARAADPLFLLCQQWRMGELGGENGGTLVQAEVHAESCALPEGPQDLSARAEAEGADQLDALTRAVLLAECSLDVLAWLKDAGRGGEIAALRTDHPLTVPAVEGSADAPRAALLSRAGFDALSARAALDAAVSVDDLALRDALDAALAARGLFPTEPLWQGERLHHAGLVASTDVDVEVREHRGGAVSWDHLAVSRTPPSAAMTRHTAITLPQPVRYAGMPSSRFWAFERGSAWLGDVQTRSDRLEPALIAEYALVYGEDWHLVPLVVEAGRLVRVTSVVVTDTFGQSREVFSAARVDAELARSRWGLWHLEGDRPLGDAAWVAAAEGPWVAVLPAPPTLDGPPVEEVRFFDDESANLGWAREGRVASWFPRPETDPGAPPDAVAEDPPATRQSDTWRWVVQSEVPDRLFPMVPRPRADGVQLDLALGRVRGSDAEPASQVLKELEAAGGTLPEETLRSPGARVVRRWRRVRRSDGSVQMWSARTVSPRKAERDVGLVFDGIVREGVE